MAKKYKFGDIVLVKAVVIVPDSEESSNYYLGFDKLKHGIVVDKESIYSTFPTDDEGNVLRRGDECYFAEHSEAVAEKGQFSHITEDGVYVSIHFDKHFQFCSKITNEKIEIDGVIYDKDEVLYKLKELKSSREG